MYRNFLSIQPRARALLYLRIYSRTRGTFLHAAFYFTQILRKNTTCFIFRGHAPERHTLKPMYTVLYEVLCALCSTRIETSKKVVNI